MPDPLFSFTLPQHLVSASHEPSPAPGAGPTLTLRSVLLLFPFYPWRNQDSEKLGNLFKVIQPVTVNGAQSQAVWLLSPPSHLCPLLHVIVSSCVVGAPVPVGVSIYVSNIEQISEMTMVSVSASDIGLRAGDMGHGAGSKANSSCSDLQQSPHGGTRCILKMAHRPQSERLMKLWGDNIGYYLCGR